jgi:tetratricopeptide (TPR) repeat protein
MLLAVATVFVVVLNVYRRSAQIKRFLLALTAIGLAVALFALYQNAFGSRMIYGVVPAVHRNSGPFLNHNAFSQFMNLSIGAMLALLLFKIREITEGSGTFGDSFQLLRYAKLNAVYALAVIILISAAMVFLSLSRGGMISLLIAGALAGILLIWRRGRGDLGSILLMFAIGAIVVVFYLALGSVFERVTTLRNAAKDNGDRAHVVEYLSHEARQYPIFGTGLGTHRYIFPMYDQSVIFGLSSYAENEYAQLMEESGAIGVALCALFLLIVGTSFFKSIWKPRRPVHYAAYGLGFGLVAILIQSASDFGQHDAANACLTAAFAALMIVLARHARPLGDRQSKHRTPSPWYGRPLRIVGAIAMVGVFILPLHGADAMRRARLAWAQTDPGQDLLDAKGWNNGSNAEYASVLLPAAEAAKIEPHDVFIGYWLNNFRWRWIERYRDPKTGVLALTAQSVNATARIVAELNKVRGICPTFAAPCSLAGRLEYFVLGRPQGERDIRSGYRLDHNDVDCCLAIAELDASQKHWAASTDEARRALELDPQGSLDTVLAIYVRYDRPDLAYDLTKDDVSGMDHLANLLRDDPKHQDLAIRTRKEATALLLEAAKSPDASPEVLASVAQFYDGQGKDAESINYYERALAKNYGVVEWRLRLAQLLVKSGNLAGAEKELRAILRLRPGMPAAMALLGQITAGSSDGK